MVHDLGGQGVKDAVDESQLSPVIELAQPTSAGEAATRGASTGRSSCPIVLVAQDAATIVTNWPWAVGINGASWFRRFAGVSESLLRHA